MTTELRRAAPPRRRAVRRLLIGLAVVMAVLLLAGGLAVWRIWATADGLQRADDLLPARTPAPAGTPGADGTAAPTTGTPVIAGSLNYVLMGSDINAGGEEGRSDVLMVAHVPPTRDKVYVISFPRDMWVTIPGRHDFGDTVAQGFATAAMQGIGTGGAGQYQQSRRSRVRHIAI